MLREEYGHSYRQCPVCKKEGLPKGLIVCCQNKECHHVINTGKDPWVDTGPYAKEEKEEKEEKEKKPVASKYKKIYEFVYSLSQQDMVRLEQVIDKRRRYGRG